ncbi:hypothetical protein [Cellulomonas sp. Leaf334]|nr:hypothetical protein [Cellulomonas sp. Leaf334]
MDLPRDHTIRERSHRILDPFTSALHLTPGTTLLGVGTAGTGVDLSTVRT